jgi:hypothetical protein
MGWLRATVATGSPASAINAQSVDPASAPAPGGLAAGADDGGCGGEGAGLGGSGGRSGCDGTGSPAGVMWELQAKDIAWRHTMNPNATNALPINLDESNPGYSNRRHTLQDRTGVGEKGSDSIAPTRNS